MNEPSPEAKPDSIFICPVCKTEQPAHHRCSLPQRSSKPSPKAKQVAGWHYKPVSLVGSPKATRFTVYDESGEPIVSVYTRSDAEAICNHHDTATAKLREELEGLRRIIATDTKQIQQLARQPLDFARDKQPSAITTNEQAYRDGTLSQPSTPTAESEAIGKRMWEQFDGNGRERDKP